MHPLVDIRWHSKSCSENLHVDSEARLSGELTLHRSTLVRRRARSDSRIGVEGRAYLYPVGHNESMSKPETYTSVWDAIADTPEQAANLRSRAELMQKIAELVRQHAWTQAEAASHSGVTQPRINDLLRGRVSRFSLDALVNIATALGCRVRIDLEAA